MLKKIVIAALALGALGVGAPAALADQPVYDCGFDTIQQDEVFGQNYEGVMSGHVAHADGGPVSIRCYITVNGSENAETPTATGSGFAATTGRITFAASDTDNVQVCAEVWTSHGVWSDCFESRYMQIPPQEVVDLVDSLRGTFDGPVLCGLPPGDYPPDLTIESDGDIYRGGTKVYDCPPYGDAREYPNARYRGRR